MQDFCDKLVVLIGEAPDPQTSTELSRILTRCKEGPVEMTTTADGDDSGGGGNTNPPSPPKKPPVIE